MSNKKKYERWTEKEDDYLRENYHNLPYKEIALKLGRDDNTVRARAYYIGLTRFPNWTEQEKDMLKRLYVEMETTELSRMLNRPRSSVIVIANRMGLNKGYRRKWTKEEDQILVDNPHLSSVELMELLPGRRPSVIQSRCYSIGIRKNKSKGEGIKITEVINGRVYKEHQAVIVKDIGRDIYSGEEVHHINLNPRDNRPENLVLLWTHEHDNIHKQLRELILDLINTGVISFNSETKRYEFIQK
jgi:hypothetical protein